MEVLFALAILIPVCFSIIGINYYSARAADSARLTTTAIHDAHTVIERLRVESQDGLAQVVATYPNGQPVPAGIAAMSAESGEQIIVNYADPGADPLDVTVTVTWTDAGRNMRKDLVTQITQR